ncbi:MAG TPA: hypothetical protein VFR81_05045 [Longimicrobium sp.]|nr:hypothetical protein [Longimicrobium sp.]
MPEQQEGEREIAPAPAGKPPERFKRRIDCAAPPVDPGAEPVDRGGGRGTGRLREPGAGLPDSER